MGSIPLSMRLVWQLFSHLISSQVGNEKKRAERVAPFRPGRVLARVLSLVHRDDTPDEWGVCEVHRLSFVDLGDEGGAIAGHLDDLAWCPTLLVRLQAMVDCHALG